MLVKPRKSTVGSLGVADTGEFADVSGELDGKGFHGEYEKGQVLSVSSLRRGFSLQFTKVNTSIPASVPRHSSRILSTSARYDLISRSVILRISLFATTSVLARLAIAAAFSGSASRSRIACANA